MSISTDDCKLYYNLTGGSGGTWVEIPVVVEDTVSGERRTSESVCRGDDEVGEHVGKPKFSISGTLLAKRSTPGATYTALRGAFVANTRLGFCAATGAKTTSGEHTFTFEGKLKKWEEARADNDSVRVSFEIARDASSTFDSEFAVVA